MNIVNKINNYELSEDTAKLILRVVVGVTVFLHGWFKLMNPEALGFIGGLFEAVYLPAFLAYLVYIGEVIAPIMLLLGWQTKVGALLVAITLAVAVILNHANQIFALSEQGGGWAIELQALMFFSAIAIFGLGAGKYSLDAKDKTQAASIQPM